jgi:hypothetical protein
MPVDEPTRLRERRGATPPPSGNAERLSVGVVLEHRRVDHPWATDRWVVVEVLPGEPAADAWTLLAEGEGWQRWYAGAAELELHRGETASYLENLGSPRPAVFIILRRAGHARGIVLHAVTVDPGEVEAHSDAGDDLIEAVPLPSSVRAWMEDFVARHHVERAFWKRRRDRADPEALGTRPAPRREDHDERR